MFPVQITVSNINQLNAVIAALGMPEVVPAPAAVQFAKSPAEAEANAKKSKTKQEPAQATVATNGASSPAPTSEAPEAAAQEPAPEAAAAAPAAASVSYEDVKKAIIKLSQGKGRDAVVALLGEFGAAAGPQLKPEQYAAFVAKAEA